MRIALGNVPVRLNVPDGAIVMLSGPEMVFAGLLASVTFTITVDVPAVVGVPVTTQPAPNARPAGSVPPVIVQL